MTATVGSSRPITNEPRRSAVEDLPEMDDISDPMLRERSIEAWAIASARSSFRRISDIPGEDDVAVAHRFGKHLREVVEWECDPANQGRWRADPSATGRPSLRH